MTKTRALKRQDLDWQELEIEWQDSVTIMTTHLNPRYNMALYSDVVCDSMAMVCLFQTLI